MNEKTFLTINLKDYRIRVFRNALKPLGPPPYIRFLVNPDDNHMVMQAYDKKDQKSFRVPKGLWT